MSTVINIKGEELEKRVDTEVCDTSRRKLLKKAYTAPVVVALGSMAFSTQAQAKHFGACFFGCGCPTSGGNSSSSSLSSGGGKCNICGFPFPCKCP